MAEIEKCSPKACQKHGLGVLTSILRLYKSTSDELILRRLGDGHSAVAHWVRVYRLVISIVVAWRIKRGHSPWPELGRFSTNQTCYSAVTTVTTLHLAFLATLLPLSPFQIGSMLPS